ncbi:MAG: hypothetical protein DRI57_11750 [Deltaproteobacteria bacterium]|nr:MAG: hypothetical protein DRI57_11750 [Deltaproteobacteria bacterium]
MDYHDKDQSYLGTYFWQLFVSAIIFLSAIWMLIDGDSVGAFISSGMLVPLTLLLFHDFLISRESVATKGNPVSALKKASAMPDMGESLLTKVTYPAILSVIPGIAGSHLFSYGFRKYQTFESIFFASVRFALPYGALLGVMSAAIIFKYFVFRQFRNKYSINNIAKSLYIIIFLSAFYFMAFTVVFMGVFSFTNGFLDTSPEETHTVTVTSKKIIKHRCFDTFRWGLTPTGFVFFESWERNRRRKALPLASGLYDGIVKGDIVSVTVRQGYHQFEWIVSYRIIPK